MYKAIEVDFDVYKAIFVRRETPEMTENDVLRELLGLPKAGHSEQSHVTKVSKDKGLAWVCKGVTFPVGTEFRAEYKGRGYFAQVEDGALVSEGKRYKTPSSAAVAITGSATSGWRFWECKMPGAANWVKIIKLLDK